LLSHYRNWPRDMQDRWLALLDHFAASTPDKETATLLGQLRATPKSLRRPLLNWLSRLLEEGIPPEALTGGVVLGIGDVSTSPSTTHRFPLKKRPGGSR
jgi:hypothetical protein